MGYCLSAGTPEGGSVGIVKNLAILTTVTNMTNPIPIHNKIENMGLIKFSEFDRGQMVKFIDILRMVDFCKC